MIYTINGCSDECQARAEERALKEKLTAEEPVEIEDLPSNRASVGNLAANPLVSGFKSLNNTFSLLGKNLRNIRTDSSLSPPMKRFATDDIRYAIAQDDSPFGINEQE